MGIVSSPDWCNAPGWYDILLLTLNDTKIIIYWYWKKEPHKYLFNVWLKKRRKQMLDKKWSFSLPFEGISLKMN